MPPDPYGFLAESVDLFASTFSSGWPDDLPPVLLPSTTHPGVDVMVPGPKYALLLDDALLRYVGHIRCHRCRQVTVREEAVGVEDGVVWVCPGCAGRRPS